MRNVRHSLVIVLQTMLSLACLSVLALWVRSYSHSDGLWAEWVDPVARVAHLRNLHSGNASVYYRYRDERYFSDNVPPQRNSSFPRDGRWRYATAPGRSNYGQTSDPTRAFLMRYGFDFQNLHDDRRSGDGTSRSRIVYVRVPHWLLAVLFAITPLYGVVRSTRSFRRARRVRRGLCPACGYDRRGDTGGPCPECGQPTPPAAAGGRASPTDWPAGA